MKAIKKHFTWLGVLMLVLFVWGGGENSSAQVSSGLDPSARDAIAVRIIPNPNHYSIARWYQSQGFRGSPQALLVDGYEAIRDGRTVYVNAANIDQATKTIYTNIYLISYNQDYADTTADILGQLITRWKFNNNLIESVSPAPTCGISSLSCQSDLDCGQGQSCSTSGATAGSCVLNEPKNCLVDPDCPTNFFCNSLKAQIIRDVKRVGRLEEFKEALGSFRQTNGRYPLLSAGTYLSGHSVSVWPSWSQVLLSDLALSPNLRDPINKLGPCVVATGSPIDPGQTGQVSDRGLGQNNQVNQNFLDPNGESFPSPTPSAPPVIDPDDNPNPVVGSTISSYDPITCWDATARRFINQPSGGTLTLPAHSYAFVYSTNAFGSEYNMCATMESRALSYAFSPDYPSSAACQVAAAGRAYNNAPRLLEYMLVGEPGQAFNGYIIATDDDGDPINWSWRDDNHPSYWDGWISGGVNNRPPLILDTSNPYQKKIYAERAGDSPGVLDNIFLRLDDGRGGILTTSTPITLSTAPIFIEAANEEYIVHPTQEFVYRFTFASANLDNPGLSSAIVSQTTGPYNLLGDFSRSFSVIANNKYQIEYKGLIPNTRQFYRDTIFGYRISVTDKFGKNAQKTFAITVKNPAPVLNFVCPGEARFGQYYQCFLGEQVQAGQALIFTASGAPNGLVISTPIRPETRMSLSGASNVLGGPNNIMIKASNVYGASSTREFMLRVNSFCGDGIKQRPNTEGRGGLFNDGYEDCDISDGTTNVVANSRIDLQYGCRTKDANTPYPILNNNYCVFASPVDGGGYCGDGYCQLKVGDVNMENSCNCERDCGKSSVPCCIPNCSGKTCGSDGCGGSCGECIDGNTCQNDQCIAPSGTILDCTSNADCQAGLKVCNCWTGKLSQMTLNGQCHSVYKRCIGNGPPPSMDDGPGGMCDPNGPLGHTWWWQPCPANNHSNQSGN